MTNIIKSTFAVSIFMALALVILPNSVDASHQTDFYCTSNSSSVEVGESVTWSVSVNGNTSDYNYLWSGTDGLSSSSSSVTTTYSTSGTKNASVHITSSNSSSSVAISRACSVLVIDPEPNLTGSCYGTPSNPEKGETVTWYANVSGGTGSYDFDWSGATNGSSQSVTESYSSSGTKTATVEIVSGSQSISKSCSVYVENNTVNDLEVYCTPNGSTYDTGDTISWTAHASGGGGIYDFDWSGAVSGNDRVENTSYGSNGTKTAHVRVESQNGDVETATCRVYIEDDYDDDLEVYCTPDGSTYDVGDRITWTAHVSGGGGDYEYDWSGTDGLDGDSRTETVRYRNDGTKRATVRVESDNGDRESATCRIYVEDEDDNDDLEITCSVSDTSIDEGDRVTIEVDIDGGDSPYDIEWSGDIDDIDDFDDNDRRQTVRIDDAGRYDIEVEVEDDDGNRDFDQCPIIRVSDEDSDITVITTTGTTGQVAGVSLAQIPYTGLTENPILNAILYTLIGFTTLVILGVIAFIIKRRSKVYSKDELVSFLENEAHKYHAIVSADAMDSIIEHSHMSRRRALKLLEKAIRKTDVSGDDWLVLSKQKVAKVM